MINKKGQSLGITIMSVILIIIIGFGLINLFFGEVDTARGLLSCSSASTISDGSKILCLIVDLQIPYWIWIIVSVGIGAVVGRLVFK